MSPPYLDSKKGFTEREKGFTEMGFAEMGFTEMGFIILSNGGGQDRETGKQERSRTQETGITRVNKA